MDAKAKTKYESRARIIKAMAHPTRLFIVDELAKNRERCVCELTEMVGADISTVSKHLAILKNAGIINDEKRRNQVFLPAMCSVHHGLLPLRGSRCRVRKNQRESVFLQVDGRATWVAFSWNRYLAITPISRIIMSEESNTREPSESPSLYTAAVEELVAIGAAIACNCRALFQAPLPRSREPRCSPRRRGDGSGHGS